MPWTVPGSPVSRRRRGGPRLQSDTADATDATYGTGTGSASSSRTRGATCVP